MNDVPEFESPKHEELYWAEKHARDLTMAEHNRLWFAKEADRIRSEIEPECLPYGDTDGNTRIEELLK